MTSLEEARTKLEQLVEMSASELEAMTPQQLEEWCKPFFDVTRPDRVRTIRAKNPNKNTTSSSKNYMPPAKRKALDALLGLGIDLSDVKGFKRK